ncbi:hypothetical protein A1OE_980 [Candidatus Endolissoclinum faulkneri L2]|uniref:Uncharacterized protein n=1 Tax=Candidatus Endolissoclinum faulkneri L2 TaxID=1193729 RepID=K7ZD40_9PROT|nr:hypothetical protein A1OE_980 [Candidatus Endolissoclinum faulkneri L2]
MFIINDKLYLLGVFFNSLRYKYRYSVQVIPFLFIAQIFFTCYKYHLLC